MMPRLYKNDWIIIALMTSLLVISTMLLRLISHHPYVLIRTVTLTPLLFLATLSALLLFRKYEAWFPLSGVKKGLLFGFVLGALWTLVRLEQWYLRSFISLRTVDMLVYWVLFIGFGGLMSAPGRTHKHLLMQDAKAYAPLGLIFLVGRIVHRLIFAWNDPPFLSGRLIMIWSLGMLLFALIAVYSGGVFSKKNPQPRAALVLMGILATVMFSAWLTEWPLYLGIEPLPLSHLSVIVTDVLVIGLGFTAILLHKSSIRRLN